jgi:hypothetical protein
MTSYTSQYRDYERYDNFHTDSPPPVVGYRVDNANSIHYLTRLNKNKIKNFIGNKKRPSSEFNPIFSPFKRIMINNDKLKADKKP